MHDQYTFFVSHLFDVDNVRVLCFPLTESGLVLIKLGYSGIWTTVLQHSWFKQSVEHTMFKDPVWTKTHDKITALVQQHWFTMHVKPWVKAIENSWLADHVKPPVKPTVNISWTRSGDQKNLRNIHIRKIDNLRTCCGTNVYSLSFHETRRTCCGTNVYSLSFHDNLCMCCGTNVYSLSFHDTLRICIFFKFSWQSSHVLWDLCIFFKFPWQFVDTCMCICILSPSMTCK